MSIAFLSHCLSLWHDSGMCAAAALIDEEGVSSLNSGIVRVVQLVYSWCYLNVEWQGVLQHTHWCDA